MRNLNPNGTRAEGDRAGAERGLPVGARLAPVAAVAVACAGAAKAGILADGRRTVGRAIVAMSIAFASVGLAEAQSLSTGSPARPVAQIVQREPEPIGTDGLPGYILRAGRAESPALAALARPKRVEAIRAASVPYVRESPDFTSLDAAIKRSQVIGIGQQTHGTREIHEGQFALAKDLILRHGVRNIVLEEGYMPVVRLNDFVTGKGGDAKTVTSRLMGCWRNQETRDFLEWMRDWNAKHPTDMVRVVGLRSQGRELDAHGELVIAMMPKDLRATAEKDVRQVVKAVNGYLSYAGPAEGRPALYDALAEASATMARLVRAVDRECVKAPQSPAYRELLIATRALRVEVANSVALSKDEGTSGKDMTAKECNTASFIHDCLEWGQEIGHYAGLHAGEKIAFLAHGSHVMKTPTVALVVEPGAVLAQREEGYCAVTFTAREGTVSAHVGFQGRNAEWLPRQMVAMGPNSLEGIAADAHGGKDLIVDMSKTGGWLEGPMSMRNVGSMYFGFAGFDEAAWASAYPARSYDFIVCLGQTESVVTEPAAK